jgi:iron complex transport system substrate-binding protein
MHDHSPRRIVCLQPSATAILHDLGEIGRVVACTRYCVDVCPDAADGRRIVADSWSADATEIVEACPDLVIAAVPYQEKAVSAILKAGSRFLGLAPRTLKDIYGDIAAIAGIVGALPRGKEIIASMEHEIEAVRSTVKASPKPRVFCEEWGKPLIASQLWVAELVEAAGGEFVGEPGKQINAQHVERLDPDLLIACWCGAGDRVPLEKVIRQRGWNKMRAAQNRRVYAIRDEFLNTPAPTLLKGLHCLAAAIHPELFPTSIGLRQITDDSLASSGSSTEHVIK